MIELNNLDKELFLYLNNLGSDRWDVFWQTITYRFTWIPLYALFLYLIWKTYAWKYFLLILLMIALLITCTDQFTNLLKYSVERLRPCRNPDFFEHMRFANCQKNGKFGFTSAHASNHFALAVFVGSILRKRYAWLIYALLIWAAVIAYSRIYVGVHYPMDILCGAMIGITFSLSTLQLYKYLSRKYLKKSELATVDISS